MAEAPATEAVSSFCAEIHPGTFAATLKHTSSPLRRGTPHISFS